MIDITCNIDDTTTGNLLVRQVIRTVSEEVSAGVRKSKTHEEDTKVE